MNFFLKIVKKIIPEPVFDFLQPAYHYALAYLGAFFYGFPSKKLFVIGVTGTKGKTTTCDLIAQIFNSSGFKTGLATTVKFGIAEKEWVNRAKQTMLGRFHLQKLLRKMVKAGCRCAVVETSSEGILQYRHRFIDYGAAVFTNLSPEHIERHGSFENYRAAKLELFEKVAEKENGAGIYNLDDPNAKYFLQPKIAKQYVYTLNLPDSSAGQIGNLYRVSGIRTGVNGTSFSFCGPDGKKEEFKTPLIGEFNVYNAAAAICTALSQGIPMEKIKLALAQARPPAGRLEIIDGGRGFKVVIDYAHEPASLEAVYKTAIGSKIKSPKSKLICLLGAQGGGRDKWKRSEMGKIAGKYCDRIILADEDPYDEDPNLILAEIKSGIDNLRFRMRNLYEIVDRRKAIEKAISMAKKGDAVVLTGKGGEVWMCVGKNKKIPWNEKQIVEEILADKK